MAGQSHLARLGLGYNWARGHWSIRRLVLLALSCDLSTAGMNMEGLVKHPPVTGKELARRSSP